LMGLQCLANALSKRIDCQKIIYETETTDSLRHIQKIWGYCGVLNPRNICYSIVS